MILSWLEDATAWDTLVLFQDGIRYEVPGTARVSATKAIDIERHTVAGQDGGIATQLGYRPASFTVDVHIIDQEEYADMERIVSLFRPEQGKEIRALDALHPQLEQIGIRQVYLMQISTAPPTSNEGQIYHFSFEEFYPEAARTSRPVKEIAEAPGNPTPSVSLPLPSATDIAGVNAQQYLPAMPSAALEP